MCEDSFKNFMRDFNEVRISLSKREREMMKEFLLSKNNRPIHNLKKKNIVNMYNVAGQRYHKCTEQVLVSDNGDIS